jgi:hypothetical protein
MKSSLGYACIHFVFLVSVAPCVAGRLAAIGRVKYAYRSGPTEVGFVLACLSIGLVLGPVFRISRACAISPVYVQVLQYLDPPTTISPLLQTQPFCPDGRPKVYPDITFHPKRDLSRKASLY